MEELRVKFPNVHLSTPTVGSATKITCREGDVVRITQNPTKLETTITVESKARGSTVSPSTPAPLDPVPQVPLPLTWPAAFVPTSEQIADPEKLKRALMEWNKARLDDEGVNYNLCSASQLLDSEFVDCLLDMHRTSLKTLMGLAGKFGKYKKHTAS